MMYKKNSKNKLQTFMQTRKIFYASYEFACINEISSARKHLKIIKYIKKYFN